MANLQPWEKMQAKTFTAWASSFLVRDGLVVEDVEKDFDDGIKLIKLVEALQNEPLGKYNKTPKMIPHRVENLNLALNVVNKFCAEIGIKLQYSAEQVMEGNVMQIMGMMWVLISRFMIANISEDELNAKEALLLWCKKKTNGYDGVTVNDFHNSWSDGLAFCALIHKHRPDLIDFQSLSAGNKKENMALAFDTAHEKLGVPKLLDPDDLIASRPDEKSVMTYLSFIWKTFAASKQVELAGNRVKSLVDKEKANEAMKNEYERRTAELLAWIDAKKAELEASVIGSTVKEASKTAAALIEYKKNEKVTKQTEKGGIESMLTGLTAKLRSESRPLYIPNADLAPDRLSNAWESLHRSERDYEERLHRELKKLKHVEAVATITDQKSEDYSSKSKTHVAWVESKIAELEGVELGETSQEVLAVEGTFEEYKRGLKASMTNERAAISSLLTGINSDRGAVDLPRFTPSVSQADIDGLWSKLEAAETAHERHLREAISVRRKTERLLERVEKEAFDIEDWMKQTEPYLAEEMKEANSVAEAEAEGARLQGYVDTYTKNTYSGDSLMSMLESAPMKTTSGDELAAGLKDILSVLGEFGAQLDAKKETVSNNLKAALELESKRLGFSSKAEHLAAWANSRTVALGAVIVCYSMADVDSEASYLDSNIEDRKKRQDIDMAALKTLNEQCRGSNPYARFTLEDLGALLSSVVDAENERSALIEKERVVQAEHDTLRRAFADNAVTFSGWSTDIKAKINAIGEDSSSAEEQIQVLLAMEDELPKGSDILSTATDSSNNLLSAGITDNEYTATTITELNVEYEVVKRILQSKRSTLETELAEKAKDVIPEKEMNELKEIFDKFDKSGDGKLNEKEIGNVLLAFDLEASPEEIKELDSGDGTVVFEPFAKFFTAKLRNADTEEQALASFDVLSEGRATISAADLGRYLSPEDVEYLQSRMPVSSEGGLDFKAYVSSVYSEDPEAQERRREEASRLKAQLEQQRNEELQAQAEKDAAKRAEEERTAAEEEAKKHREQEKIKLEEEAAKRKEEEEKAEREAEAIRIAEEQEKLQREAEERAKQEAEEHARKLKAELEEQERLNAIAEAKAEEERKRMQAEIAFKKAIEDAEMRKMEGKEGLLTKQGGRFGGYKSWHPRFCKLTKEGELGVLRWSASKNAATKGEILISYGTEIAEEDVKGKGMCIVVKTPGSAPFYAQAESDSEKNEWISIMKLFSGEDMPRRSSTAA